MEFSSFYLLSSQLSVFSLISPSLLFFFFLAPFWPVCISILLLASSLKNALVSFQFVHCLVFDPSYACQKNFYSMFISFPAFPFPLFILFYFFFFCVCVDFKYYCLAKVESRLHVLRYSLVRTEKRANRMYKKISL